jgi:hypothetical protein
LCAAILDRRDTVPAPPFSTAVNTEGGDLIRQVFLSLKSRYSRDTE